MTLTRRQFIKLGSATTLCMSFKGRLPATHEPAGIDSLYKAFKDPANTARPFVRWWWNGNMINEKELLRELDLLKEAGIGGVEINPIKIPAEDDTMGLRAYDWLSSDWNALLKKVLEGAKERGITCDTIVGSGWPFGGEFLNRDEQIQMIAVGMRELEGPLQYSIHKAELVNEVEPDIHSRYENKEKQLFMLRLAPGYMENFDPGIDLNGKITDDIITFDVPRGKHVLYYLVKFTGYMAVINGAPGAKGPVLNHYDKKAVEKYLNRMSDTLNREKIPLNKFFRSMFVDSFELEGANWCHDLFEQFEKRRSYSLVPYFPFILFKIGKMGNPVPGKYGSEYAARVAEIIQRVRYDFEVTLVELFHERFIVTFQEWCNKWGVKSRMQAYGRGCHPLESSMHVDIPECETWLGPSLGKPMPEFDHRQGRAYTMVNKFVSSGARLAGKKLISCEELTNVGMVFNESLNHFKIAGDLSNISGVTHSILHGFNYSPEEAPFPGWIRYGIFLNERNTWWPYFKRWSDYKSRLSALFQQADFYAHIAVLHPLSDMWMKMGSQRDPFPTQVYPKYAHALWEAIHQNGNSCDYVSENIIQTATAGQGFFKYGSRSYKVLMLMEVESLQPQTALALERFVRTGGRILFIGKVPFRSPGFYNHAEYDRQVANTMNIITQKYPDKAAWVPAPQENILGWFTSLQSRFKLDEYVSFDKPVTFVSQVHYKYGDADIFFIVNSSNERSCRLKATFHHVHGKRAYLWNPEDGSQSVYPFSKAFNELVVELGPADSRLIVFAAPGITNRKFVAERKLSESPVSLSGAWEVSLHAVNGEKTTVKFQELKDFKDDSKLRSFAGTAIYRKEIAVVNPMAFNYLDLGLINGVSELTVNNVSLGKKWYGKHIYDLNGSLQEGKNQIEIKVITLLGNYAKSLSDNKVTQVWTRNQPYYSAGLIGPVKLL
jgi:hypothetical protein